MLAVNLTDCRFGRLIAIKPLEKRANRSVVWECKCDCGKIVSVSASCLRGGNTRSCGCVRIGLTRERKHKLGGKTFGKLYVVSRSEKRRRAQVLWNCNCECGQSTTVSTNSLINGRSRSCGSCSRFTHGHTKSKNRERVTPEYKAWGSMKRRCLNPKEKSYKHYGGRGITVCERWKNSFSDFLSDMGYRPSPKHSIDRIDVNGNYEPSNCRWATIAIQSDNTRRTKYLTYNGVTKTVTEWARDTGISANAIHLRLYYKWSIERTLTQPPQKRTTST